MLAVALSALIPILPPANPPGLVATIGTTAFRHSLTHPLAGEVVLGVSSDCKRIYTGDFAGCSGGETFNRVYVWEAASGKMVNSYEPAKHVGRIWQYRFSSEGLRVIAFSKEANVFPKTCRWYLLDPDTGVVIRQGMDWVPPPVRPMGYTNDFAFVREMPADRWTVHYTPQETFLLDPVTGGRLQFSPAIDSKEADIHVSPDGKSVVVDPGDRSLTLYDLPSLKFRSELAEEQNRIVDGFTPDSQSVIIWGKRRMGWALELWNREDKTRRTLLEGMRKPGLLRFSADGKKFAHQRLGQDDRYDAWAVHDAKTGNRLFRLPGYSFKYFDPDGKTIWAMSGGHLWVPFDAQTGVSKTGGRELTGPVERFRFINEACLIGLSREEVIAWEARTAKETYRKPLPRGRDWSCTAVFTPAGDRLVYTDESGAVLSWDVHPRDESKLSEWKPESAGTLTLDGRGLVSSDDGLAVRDPFDFRILLERPVPEEWRTRDDQPPVREHAMSADGKCLAAVVGGYPKPSIVHLLDLTDAKSEVWDLTPNHHVATLTFTPDSRQIVLGGDCWVETKTGNDIQRILSVWDLGAMGEPKIAKLPCHAIRSAKCSPDGKLIAVHCGDRMLLLEFETLKVKARIWTGRPDYVTTLPSESEGDTLAWSPSGKLLAVQMGDERIAIWDIEKMLGR